MFTLPPSSLFAVVQKYLKTAWEITETKKDLTLFIWKKGSADTQPPDYQLPTIAYFELWPSFYSANTV